MITINNKIWVPQKLANDKAGEIIDWESRIKNPNEWLISHKYDGARVEIIDGQAYSRELNLIKSVQVQEMAYRLAEKNKHLGVIEAEFYDPTMNWSELMHFFKTEDVTSSKTFKKYQSLWMRTQGLGTKWKFKGRDLKWATTWHDTSKFYVFDEVYQDEARTKEERYSDLFIAFEGGKYTKETMLIIQQSPNHIDQIYQAYDQVILDGGEGLVAMKKKALYKLGRITLNSNDGYKIKDSNVEFKGTIIRVKEGTIAKEGSIKTVNAFGRSKTSQLKEDRIPSGLCKGFKVRMADGRELTVSLNGYTHEDKKDLLRNPSDWIGLEIMFTGMNPVKSGGNPRHAHYTNPKINV